MAIRATATTAAATIARPAASTVELGLERDGFGDIAPVGCQTDPRNQPPPGRRDSDRSQSYFAISANH